MKDLKRDDLEREIIRYDKLKLVSECLKLFDSNKMLRSIIDNRLEQIATLSKEKNVLRIEVGRLESRSLWDVLNERIEQKINKIRNRRNLTELNKAK